MSLDWPAETVLPAEHTTKWGQAESNLVLDYHGDPLKAKLVVFSDGNHHMALLESLKAFYEKYPDVSDVFYATTPPYPILMLLRTGAIRLGNLTLSVRPHVFISPPHVLDDLQAEGYIETHEFLGQNQGSVLLITRDNPKGIKNIDDLMRSDIRLFVSNPETEKVSYEGYRQTLEGMAESMGLDMDAFRQAVFGETVVWGRQIHHREAPEAVAAGRADAAIVYYHLGLRYIRIFPEQFHIIPLGGTITEPAPHPENRISRFHIGIIGDGGEWGARFAEFMQTQTVAGIYASHGLRHRLDMVSGL